MMSQIDVHAMATAADRRLLDRQAARAARDTAARTGQRTGLTARTRWSVGALLVRAGTRLQAAPPVARAARVEPA